MRALTFSSYTDASGLRLTGRPAPSPQPDRVLVRVAAVGLNPFDWHQYRGEPWLLRAGEGWRVREPRVVGADLAGVVEAVGVEVQGFAPGDRVLGSIGRGALAELALARPTALATLPDTVPFDTAAATPMAGLTALQALRDRAGLRQGERVLVWGASGGVGHLAVQLARTLGASHVAATGGARSHDLLRDLGADELVDDRSGERPTGRFDVIVDTVSTLSTVDARSLLTPAGRIVTIGGIGRGRLLGPAAALGRRALAAKLRRVDARSMLAAVRSADLAFLADELAAGRLRPVIERTYGFEQATDALRTLEGGHVLGKLVVTVAEDPARNPR
jgi:NADPH:quinone reductase-like Zn-dependent oxidoreductase